jgi:uncharacterized protein YjiS (DUF1127 family)
MLSIVPSLVAKLRGWQERQRVLNELYAMDDRALADIGLARGDIPYVVKGTAPAAPGVLPRELPVPANSTAPRAAGWQRPHFGWWRARYPGSPRCGLVVWSNIWFGWTTGCSPIWASRAARLPPSNSDRG